MDNFENGPTRKILDRWLKDNRIYTAFLENAKKADHDPNFKKGQVNFNVPVEFWISQAFVFETALLLPAPMFKTWEDVNGAWVMYCRRFKQHHAKIPQVINNRKEIDKKRKDFVESFIDDGTQKGTARILHAVNHAFKLAGNTPIWWDYNDIVDRIHMKMVKHEQNRWQKAIFAKPTGE